MSILTSGIATCGDLQDLYWNSDYATRISEYEILERFANSFGLDSSEYENIRDRCPTAKIIYYLKDEKGNRFFNIKKDKNGKEIFALNQLVEYYYTQAICIPLDCSTYGTCTTNECGDSDQDECSDEFECYCVDEEICETNDDECDTECTDAFGTN